MASVAPPDAPTPGCGCPAPSLPGAAALHTLAMSEGRAGYIASCVWKRGEAPVCGPTLGRRSAGERVLPSQPGTSAQTPLPPSASQRGCSVHPPAGDAGRCWAAAAAHRRLSPGCPAPVSAAPRGPRERWLCSSPSNLFHSQQTSSKHEKRRQILVQRRSLRIIIALITSLPFLCVPSLLIRQK